MSCSGCSWSDFLYYPLRIEEDAVENILASPDSVARAALAILRLTNENERSITSYFMQPDKSSGQVCIFFLSFSFDSFS